MCVFLQKLLLQKKGFCFQFSLCICIVTCFLTFFLIIASSCNLHVKYSSHANYKVSKKKINTFMNLVILNKSALPNKGGGEITLP